MSIASFMINEGIDEENYTFEQWLENISYTNDTDRLHEFDEYENDPKFLNEYDEECSVNHGGYENEIELTGYEIYQNTFFYKSNKWKNNTIMDLHGTINNIHTKIKIVRNVYQYYNDKPDDNQILFNYSLGEKLRNIKRKRKMNPKIQNKLYLCLNNQIKQINLDLMDIESLYYSCSESACADRFLTMGDEIINYSPANCKCKYEIKMTNKYLKDNFVINHPSTATKLITLENIAAITILAETNYQEIFGLTEISAINIIKNMTKIYKK